MTTNLLGSNQALDSSLDIIISAWRLLEDYPTVFESTASAYRLDPHTGTGYIINNYNRMVAVSVADGADIAQAQSLADTSLTITPGEVAVQTWLPGSTMRRAADPDLLGRTSKILMNALNLRQDQDGGAQMANWTNSVGAGNTTILGAGTFLAAVTRLMIGNNKSNPEPAPEPYYIVAHPMQLLAIAGRLMPLTDVPTGTTAYAPPATAFQTVGAGFGGGEDNSVSGRLVREGIGSMGMFFGANVKRSANVTLSGTNGAISGAYSKDGLVYVEEISRRIDPDTSDKSYRGAIELNGWMSYGWALYRPGAFGVEVIGDATTPTS